MYTVNLVPDSVRVLFNLNIIKPRTLFVFFFKFNNTLTSYYYRSYSWW